MIGSLVWFWPVNTDRAPFALARGPRNHYVSGNRRGALSKAAKDLFFGATPTSLVAARHRRDGRDHCAAGGDDAGAGAVVMPRHDARRGRAKIADARECNSPSQIYA